MGVGKDCESSGECPAQAHACMPQGGVGLQEPGVDEAECVSHVWEVCVSWSER